jgi:hypothetical protein
MVIGLINQAAYLCDKKFKEGGMNRKENGRFRNKISISKIIILIFIIIGVTSMNACGFLGLGGTTSWKE